MVRVWYVEVIRMMVVVANLLLLGSLASSSYEQYQNLDGKDTRFWRKLIVLLLLFSFFILIVVLGLWGALVHSVTALQSALVLLAVGTFLLILFHFNGILVWEIDMKRGFFLGAIVISLCIFYFIMINYSKTEIYGPTV